MHALRMTTKKTMRFNTDKHKNDITTLFLAKLKLYQFTLYTQRNCSLFHSNNIVRLLIRTNYIGFNVLSMLLLLLFFFQILYLACEKQIEIWHMRLFAHIEFFHNESHRISIETADIPIKRHINWKWPKKCVIIKCLLRPLVYLFKLLDDYENKNILIDFDKQSDQMECFGGIKRIHFWFLGSNGPTFRTQFMFVYRKIFLVFVVWHSFSRHWIWVIHPKLT